MDKISQIELALKVVKEEYATFDKKKTGSASTKVRGALLVMRKLTDELRKEVLTEIKEIRAKRKEISERVESEVKAEVKSEVELSDELPDSPPVLTRSVTKPPPKTTRKRKSKVKAPSLEIVLPDDF